MDLTRLARKAAVELLPVLLTIVVGYFTDNAEAYGFSSATVWVLLQMRRALRDITQGVPE